MLKRISTTRGFLLDGYPREISQGILFEEEVKKTHSARDRDTFSQFSLIAGVAWHGRLASFPTQVAIAQLYAQFYP